MDGIIVGRFWLARRCEWSYYLSMPATNSATLTYSTRRCYACDADACGVRDRRPEGGVVEAACKRHADPTIKAYAACMYCSGPRPTLDIDGDFAHKKCHAEASE